MKPSKHLNELTGRVVNTHDHREYHDADPALNPPLPPAPTAKTARNYARCLPIPPLVSMDSLAPATSPPDAWQ